jgi:5'-nucleotidase
MERDLESDPTYAPRFATIGQAAVELDLTNIDRGESVLGDFVMDTLRTAPSVAVPALGHAAFSTASSFRASIPPGAIRLEDYQTALPYTNKILSLSMTGAAVRALVELAAARLGSDNFAVTSGLRYTIAGGKVQDLAIAKDPTARSPEYQPLDDKATDQVRATDFIANIAAGYSDIFKAAAASQDTGLIVNNVVLGYIGQNSPVSAKLEGRITVTGGASP